MDTNLIREIREKAGLTQVQLAELMHVRQATISRWETKGFKQRDLIAVKTVCGEAA